MLRLWLIAILAAGLLVVVKSHDLLHTTGLLGHCAVTRTPPGAKGSWRACNKGMLDGSPDLSGDSCSPRVSDQGTCVGSKPSTETVKTSSPSTYET